MMTTPANMKNRMAGPYQRGLGLGLGLGGGWYRRRFDFDLGTRGCYRGSSFSVASATASTSSRPNGSGWYSPFDHSGMRSLKCGDAGCPDCPTVCVPTDCSMSERSMLWRHDGVTPVS